MFLKQTVFLTFEHSDVIQTPFVGNQSRLPSHHHLSENAKTFEDKLHI